jgi:hypothetical protein
MVKVILWKHKTHTHRLLGVLQGLAGFVDSLVMVLSLATLTSNLQFSVAMLALTEEIKNNEKSKKGKYESK